MPSPSLPQDLLALLAELDDPAELQRVLGDLLTPAETEAIAERWAIAGLLLEGRSQRSIAEELGVSITTVSRGSRQVKYGQGGFRLAYERLGRVEQT